MLFEPVDLKEQKAKIIVVGVGGGGGNAPHDRRWNEFG